MKLVIVESPTKCETIKRYLGDEYIVKASYGHIRDLATKGKGGLGIDVDNKFAPAYIINKDKPAYIINKDKKKVVYDLQKLAKEADEVILATDPDREGEAIAWHLAKVLDLNIGTNKRLEFHEITRDSIGEAMQHPRTIDLALVSSQETRRMLDRIIGFKLSALINKKIHSKSAGRVQSATLKLAYDQELKIDEFVPEEYYKINCVILLNNKEHELTFVNDTDGNKEVLTKEHAEAILKLLNGEAKAISVEKTVKTIDSKEPFTTSTLQQEAFSRLKFKTDKTQRVAQSLYEGISVNGEHVGLITYMRTDSTRLAPVFVERAKNYIIETFGKEYLGRVKQFKATELTQDAHEAIRPTANHRTPDSIRQYLTPDQYNLYKLIYNRTIASLLKGKKEEILSVSFSVNGVKFKSDFARTIFQGYEIIYKDEEEGKHYKNLPEINVGDSFIVAKSSVEQKFTTPPSRYSEAKIVKLMEEVGIPFPEKRFKQYPFEFSGGMRQRIVIAIALTADPDILICDEPTTALDVTIQAQILELINRLKRERNISCIFITHDLGVVANMADRVAVMYAGKIVEYGTEDDIFYDPRHPYTWALLSSIPDINSKEKLEAIPGTPPNMIYPPKGDAFALRSKYAMAIDFKKEPPLFKISDTHYAATWLLDPRAPKVEMPKIVKTRIENSLKAAKGGKTNA